jgi:hypothetical protein
LWWTESTHPFLALQTIGWGKAEEFVTFLSYAVTELVEQILVHELNPEVTVGYINAIHEILKNGAQTISFVPDSVSALFCRHRSPISIWEGNQSKPDVGFEM